MPEEALLKAIEEDARAQSGRMVKEAEQEALSMVKKAEEEVEAAREARLRASEEMLRKRRASMVGSARARARALVTEAELRLVDEVIAAAREKMAKLPEEEYSNLVNAFYEELQREWQRERGDAPLVLANPEDLKFIKDSAGARPDPDISLGVVFTSTDGRVRFENTFDSRLRKQRDRVVEELHRILFPEKDADGPQLL